MTAIFLQVRINSTRLPRKALLKLGGKTVVEHAMQALSSVKADTRQLLTTADSADALRQLAQPLGWGVFTGSEEDVLARFVMAARECAADQVVRATGDNPLVSASMAAAAIALSKQSGADYAGFRLLPLGSGVEVVTAAALEEAYREAVRPYEREHVTPFLYHRPERYRIVTPDAPEPYCAPDSRVTLDTREDYDFLRGLYDALYRNSPLDLDLVVPYLRAGGDACRQNASYSSPQ